MHNFLEWIFSLYALAMLETIIVLISEFTFLIFIVTSLLFGISLAVNLFISNTIKKIRRESDKNYKTLTNEEQAKCDLILSQARNDLSVLARQTKDNKKIRQNNRFLKFFHLKEKSEIVIEKDFKTIFRKTLQDIFSVFEKGDKKSYLSLSEKDVFVIAISLKERLNSLISSAKIIWLKRLPISVILYCLSVYNTAMRIKNKFFVALTLKIIVFFSWIFKIFSPTGLSKKLVKDLSGDSVEEIITNSFIEILVKELCVIYKEICNGNAEINI